MGRFAKMTVAVAALGLMAAPLAGATPALARARNAAAAGCASTIRLSNANNNQSITLPGQECADLTLSGDLRWTTPAGPGQSVQVTRLSSGTSGGEFLIKPVAPGDTSLSSQGTPVCAPGMACPFYESVFRLEVTVTR